MTILYALYSFFITFNYMVVNCEQVLVEEKCNFFDSSLQPNTFRLLSSTIIPKLEGKSKGEAGKIVVIGGSIQYSGAPYFAAITALKVGADLVHVITTEDASPVIKSYSPDLIVHPYLSAKHASKIRALLPKMHVVIIGPGLGREDATLHLIHDIIEECKTLRKPLILDADSLFAIYKDPSVLKNYPCPGAILTPNQREAAKLIESVSNNSSNWYTYWGDCVSVLVKGEKDAFHSNASNFVWTATGGGSGRRAGGQGDILSGALGTFYNWALNTDLCQNENNTQLAQSVASYAAAKLTRLCNFRAFTQHGRSMTASDMIQEIHAAFDSMFPGL
ncbi:ATP-dependent (S)-NAD(P)H-hydrate dehydratase-like [Anticarsia gemmatalis]|uniref:ATP-dependent (S)-NAD(P)H-hydrate dehydratase-like n=1 Tax=Anticarsia gemmatalis TaxID=129554 RepID=UPI003F76A59A